MIGKKSHTKGNYSVYTKDFNKLMKEQSVVDRMSARRIRPQNTYEEINQFLIVWSFPLVKRSL